MLLPLSGLAEETAPGATLTTITFHDYALLGDLANDELNAAAKDLLDALTLLVYQSPDGRMVSYDAQLGGQSVALPGLLKTMDIVLKKYGTMTLKEVAAPAIRCALRIPSPSDATSTALIPTVFLPAMLSNAHGKRQIS